MAYKAPATRKAIKSRVKAILLNWIDENLDDSGDTSTTWDDADDAAARAYEDAKEDGASDTAAMKAARVCFYETLWDGLGAQLEDAFTSAGE